MRYNLNNKIIIVILLVLLILGCRRNQSPYSPYTPIGPTTGVVKTYYYFSSLSIDSNGDSVAIRYFWGNGDTSDWSSWVGSGEVVTMLYSWLYSGEYYLKAQAMDMKGFISEWSLPHSIIIIPNQPPNTPSIPSGCTLGYIQNSYPFSSCATDPDEDSIAIRFDWGDGNTSGFSTWVPNGDSVRMSHSWAEPDTYHIKAQAKDIHEFTSEWSLPHTMIVSDVVPTEPPYPPSIPSGPSSGYGSTFYQFSSCAIDPDGELVAIRFYWDDGDTSVFSSWVPNGDSVRMSHSWAEPDTYYIKAQAIDIHGARSAWSGWHLIEIISKKLKLHGRIGNNITSTFSFISDSTENLISDEDCLIKFRDSNFFTNTSLPIFRHDLKHTGRVDGGEQ